MKRHRVAYSTATSETQRSDEDQGEEKEDEKKRKVVSDDEKERVDEDVDGSGDEPRNDDDEDQDEGEGEGESDNDGDVSENEDGNEINEKGGGGDSSSTCARCLASSDKSIANKPNAERLELMERVTHLEVDELQGIIGKLNVNTLRSLVLRALAGEASLEDDEKKVVGTLSSSGTSSSSSRMGRPVTAALVTYESAIKTKTSRLTKQVVLEVAALPRLPSSTWSYVFQYLAFCDMVAVHQVSRTARRLVCHPASWYHVRLEATVHLAWLLRFVPQLVQRARAVYCTDSYNERYAAGPAGLGSSGSVAPLLARVWLTQAKGLPNTLRELRLTTFFKVAFSLNGSTWRPALLNYTRVSDAADNQDVDGARVSTHWPHLCALELDVDDAPPYARVAFREFTKIASLTKLVLRHPPVAVMCPQDAPVLSGDEKEASPGVVCTIPSRFEWLEIIGWQCRVASSVTDDGSSSSSTSGDDVVSCLRVLRTGSGTCASISRIASWPPSLTHLAVGDLMSNPTFSQSANVMTTSTSDPPKHPSALVTPPSHIASMQFDAFAKSLPVLGYLLLEDVTLRDPSHWTILSSLVTLTRIDIINGNAMNGDVTWLATLPVLKTLKTHSMAWQRPESTDIVTRVAPPAVLQCMALACTSPDAFRALKLLQISDPLTESQWFATPAKALEIIANGSDPNMIVCDVWVEVQEFGKNGEREPTTACFAPAGTVTKYQHFATGEYPCLRMCVGVSHPAIAHLMRRGCIVRKISWRPDTYDCERDSETTVDLGYQDREIKHPSYVEWRRLQTASEKRVPRPYSAPEDVHTQPLCYCAARRITQWRHDPIASGHRINARGDTFGADTHRDINLCNEQNLCLAHSPLHTFRHLLFRFAIDY